MLRQKRDIYNELSLKYCIPKQVITQICNHPFIFANRRIADPDDDKGMMFAYLFKIRLKRRYRNEHKKDYYKIRDERIKRESNPE
jgi:hypothetical protein